MDNFMKYPYKQCSYCENAKVKTVCERCDGQNNFVRVTENHIDELFNGTKREQPADMVNHPPHYQAGDIEVIDVIKAFTQDCRGVEATDTGNIIKYICRWKNKNGIEDLKKAQWYLNHLIAQVEKEIY